MSHGPYVVNAGNVQTTRTCMLPVSVVLKMDFIIQSAEDAGDVPHIRQTPGTPNQTGVCGVLQSGADGGVPAQSDRPHLRRNLHRSRDLTVQDVQHEERNFPFPRYAVVEGF